jgi:hypothetical protein
MFGDATASVGVNQGKFGVTNSARRKMPHP